MKRLLDTLSRVWKLIRALILFRTVWDFCAITSMMPAKG